MAADSDIPPVPVPPTGAAVPPVEPAPTVPAPPTAAPSAVPPPVPAPELAPPPPRVDPYAAPGAAVNPPPGYSAPGAAVNPPPGYAPPPGYGAPAAYGTPGYAPAQANGLSIASMITGIAGVFLSFFGAGFLPALAGVITGHMAQRRQPYAKPFWLTGLITGYVGVGISVLTGLVAILFIIAGIGGASYFG